MTPQALLETAVLLGVFVSAGGAYACLYTLGRLHHRTGLIRASLACWFCALVCAAVLAVASPLGLGWKLLILASAAAYIVIPPITWRYLQRLHSEEGQET